MGVLLAVLILVATAVLAFRHRVGQIKKLEVVTSGKVGQFWVLVSDQSHPKIVDLGEQVRMTQNAPIRLEDGQKPIEGTDDIRSAATVVMRTSEQIAFSIVAAVSGETVTLEVNHDEFTYWSRYAVKSGAIVPLEHAHLTKRDLVAAFSYTLNAMVVVFIVVFATVAALRLLLRRTDASRAG